MASLQARHARGCEIGRPWTPFDQAEDGCSCAPTYYVAVRDGKKLDREKVGKNRKVAERALRKIQVAVDEDEFEPSKRIRFEAWADIWLEGLAGVKASTYRDYETTMKYARDALGDKVVRRLGVEDVKRFLAKLRERGMSESTRAKHLRNLGVCLESAIAADYAARNPVRRLPENERPTPETTEAPYFANDELPRLFAAVPEGVFQVLFAIALKTGVREGELAALEWGDVDLLDRKEIRVRKTWNPRDGLTSPKSRSSRREVHLTEELIELLGRWWGELGSPADDQLVFPGDDGYLTPDVILRHALYPAMKKAKVPRVGPMSENPRTFHSFRHTFSKIALENGRTMYWLSKRLGHSSIQVTERVYAHLEPKQRQREAEELAGAFPV